MINWGTTTLAGIDTFTGWHWLLEVSWHQTVLPRRTWAPLEEQPRSECYLLVSEDGYRRWRIARLLAVRNLRDFSVSALCREDESASISWCMRSERQSRLSGEPRLWGGYLKLFFMSMLTPLFLRLLLERSPIRFDFLHIFLTQATREAPLS